VQSQQLQWQVETQHRADTGNYISDKRIIKTTAIITKTIIQFYISEAKCKILIYSQAKGQTKQTRTCKQRQN
jgi:hypothetical protein